MASGDTKVTIVNQALVLLGSDTISSFSDTTNDAARIANSIYETIKCSRKNECEIKRRFTENSIS